MENRDLPPPGNGGWYFIKLRVPYFVEEPGCDPPFIPLRAARVREFLESDRLPDFDVLLDELTAYLEEQPGQWEQYRRFFAALAYDAGVQCGKAGEHAQAYGWFVKSVEANPTDVQALSNLGTSLRMLGRYEEALEAYERAERVGLNRYQSIRLAILVGECEGEIERRQRRKARAHGRSPGKKVAKEAPQPEEDR